MNALHDRLCVVILTWYRVAELQRTLARSQTLPRAGLPGPALRAWCPACNLHEFA
jgi:hypothetical protein